jgi:hypothetical protein
MFYLGEPVRIKLSAYMLHIRSLISELDMFERIFTCREREREREREWRDVAWLEGQTLTLLLPRVAVPHHIGEISTPCPGPLPLSYLLPSSHRGSRWLQPRGEEAALALSHTATVVHGGGSRRGCASERWDGGWGGARLDLALSRMCLLLCDGRRDSGLGHGGGDLLLLSEVGSEIWWILGSYIL